MYNWNVGGGAVVCCTRNISRHVGCGISPLNYNWPIELMIEGLFLP